MTSVKETVAARSTRRRVVVLRALEHCSTEARVTKRAPVGSEYSAGLVTRRDTR